jgi:hypothetical protein
MSDDPKTPPPKWWKLEVRPQADSYTSAGLALIITIMAVLGLGQWRHSTPGWRIAAVIALGVTAGIAIRRGIKLPPDPSD